jgi:hypothetical protein
MAACCAFVDIDSFRGCLYPFVPKGKKLPVVRASSPAALIGTPNNVSAFFGAQYKGRQPHVGSFARDAE